MLCQVKQILRGKRPSCHNTVSVSGSTTVFLLAWKAGQSKNKEQIKIHLKITLKIYICISESSYFSSCIQGNYHHPALQRSNVLKFTL